MRAFVPVAFGLLAVAAVASLSGCKKGRDTDHDGVVVGRSDGPPEVRVFRRTYERVRASGHRSMETYCALWGGKGSALVAGLEVCEPKVTVVVDPKGARAAVSANGRTQIVFLRQPRTWGYVVNQDAVDWSRVPDFLTGGAAAAFEDVGSGAEGINALIDDVRADGGDDAVVRMIAEAGDDRNDRTCTSHGIESALASALNLVSPELAKRIREALAARLMKPGRTGLRRAALSAPDFPELGAALVARLEEIVSAELDDPVVASFLLRRAALLRPVEAGALACRLLASTPSKAVLAEKHHNSFPGSPAHLSDPVIESVMGAIVLGQTKCASVPRHPSPCEVPDHPSGPAARASMVCRSTDAATCSKLAEEIARAALSSSEDRHHPHMIHSHTCPLQGGPSLNATALLAAAWRMQEPDARRCPEKVTPQGP